MFNKLFNLRSLLPVLVILFLASCNTEEFQGDDAYLNDLILQVDDLTARTYTADLAELDMGEEWDQNMVQLRGQRPCFKLVFPISVFFPDNDAPQVFESIEEMRAALRDWKLENQDFDFKPAFFFPINVVLRDGTEMTIENEEQFIELKKDCWNNRPNVPVFKLCFHPVFPLTILYPDGLTVVVEDKDALRAALKQWKIDNPDSAEHPEIVFPIEVETEDGGTQTVASMDELKELLKDCIEKMRKEKKKGWKKGGK